jgi:hypothetical protein
MEVSVSFTLRPLYSEVNNPGNSADWISELLLDVLKLKKKILPLPGIEPRMSGPHPSHYTDYNIPVP